MFFVWRKVDGKKVEKYINHDNVSMLKEQIENRKRLEKELKEIRKSIGERENFKSLNLKFKTLVRIGESLKLQIAITKKYKKRECFRSLHDYVFGQQQDKVFILYGLIRTGKTTMIRQVIDELSDKEFLKAAFI